jgi:hypothetical protein
MSALRLVQSNMKLLIHNASQQSFFVFLGKIAAGAGFLVRFNNRENFRGRVSRAAILN